MTSESNDENSTSKEKNNIKHDRYLGAPAPLFRLAKQLRLEETAAEKLPWARLSRSQSGVNFRRQHPIYYYVADFYCHSHKSLYKSMDPFMIREKTNLTISYELQDSMNST